MRLVYLITTHELLRVVTERIIYLNLSTRDEFLRYTREWLNTQHMDKKLFDDIRGEWLGLFGKRKHGNNCLNDI